MWQKSFFAELTHRSINNASCRENISAVDQETSIWRWLNA